MSDLVSCTRELAIDTKRLVTAHVEKLMAPLQAKIEMLEHRIAALDAQPKSLDYAGHDPRSRHTRGSPRRRRHGSYAVAFRAEPDPPVSVSGCIYWSRRSDLNRGPADYELSAGESPGTLLDTDGRFPECSRPPASSTFASRPSLWGSVWGSMGAEGSRGSAYFGENAG
jgi:hypothetical protein